MQTQTDMSLSYRPTIQEMHYSRVPTYAPVRESARLMTYQGFEPAFDDGPHPVASPHFQSHVVGPPAPTPAHAHVQPPPFSPAVNRSLHPVAPPQKPSSPALTWKQKYMRARLEQKQSEGGETQHARPSAPSMAHTGRETGLGHARGCSTCTMPKIKK